LSLDRLLQQVMNSVLVRFIPAEEWFEAPEEGAVWIKAFRVHRVPLNKRLAVKPRVLDFDRVRAVFIEVEMPYPNFMARVLPEPGGAIKDGSKMTGWETTQEGVILLIITPFPPKGSEVNARRDAQELEAWERLDFLRTVLVVTLGRNAAFEPLFGFGVDVGSGDISQRALIEDPRSFPAPSMEEPAMNLVSCVYEKIESLELEMQSRIRLALRWYQRALGDWRTLQPGGGEVDGLLNYWVALETLTTTSERGVAGAIIKRLAEIHGFDTQQAGQTFPISGVYKLRKRIMHRGEMVRVHGGLLDFLSDVFFDILLNELELQAPLRTQKYWDGSAWDFT
jgi:hypothetical protein